METTEVGSLMQLGPDDTIFYTDENGASPIFLEEYEHAIVLGVTEYTLNTGTSWQYDVLIGNQVFSVLERAER
tara:strand:- start:142 stop:360 length:219 start_codon:yes stop_codon:yes gene_type:complete